MNMRRIIYLIFISILIFSVAAIVSTTIASIHMTENFAWLKLMGFFFFGLLLGLTPCAMPVLIMMTNICNTEIQPGCKYPKTTALIYTLTLGIFYFIIGLIITEIILLLPNFSRLWIYALLSILLFASGLSLLGLFKIHIKSQWIDNLRAPANLQKHHVFTRAMIMGSIATWISTPCVLAPLIALLTYVIIIENMFSASLGFLLTGLGFGFPVLIYFVAGSKIIQKAGEWQNHITTLFGLLLIGMSIYFLVYFFSRNTMMFIWSAFAIFTAIIINMSEHAKKRSLMESKKEVEVCSIDGESITNNTERKKNVISLVKMLSMMIMIYGLILLIGALLGNDNIFSPFKNQLGITTYINMKMTG